MSTLTKPALCALALGVCLSALAPAVAATTVYRCGPNGNIYADQPCAQGRRVSVDDDREDAQRVQAQRVVALDRQLAAEMQAERLAREAALPRGAAAIGPRTAPVNVIVLRPAAKKRIPRHGLRAAEQGSPVILVQDANAPRQPGEGGRRRAQR